MYTPQVVAEKLYIADKLKVPFESLSQSYVRAETLLATQNTIAFVIQAGQKTTFLPTERPIKLNDEFVITHVFIGLKKVAAASPTNTEQIVAKVLTYENPVVFDGGGGDANVGGIYNGSLSITIDRVQFLPAIPVRSFRRVPQQQQNAVITDVYPANIDEFPNGLYGFYPIEPVKVDGRQTLNIQIDLGDAVDMDVASESNYAVLELRGYLVTNAKS